MITKNYIKMCGKAKEIQKLQPSRMWHILSERPDDGLDDNDYLYVSPYYLPKEKGIRILKWDNDEGHPIIGGYSDSERGAIWLPTQEQLQEMIPRIKNKVHVLFRFDDFLKDKYSEDSAQCTFVVLANLLMNWDILSDKDNIINGLWLAFVMKEKYNKTWTGKDWVIIGKTNKTNQKV